MAQECAFFNAELSGTEYDRVYLAETFAAYFASFIGNGVYYDSLEDLEVCDQDTPDMTVQILTGQAWINGYWYRNTSTHTLSISAADGTLDRIDRIVLRWDNEERDMYLTVLQGTASASPVAPSITRDSDYYDLVLANITVAAGVTTITQSAITDTRADSNVCGWVTGVVEQIDLSDLYSQWTTFFNEFKENYAEAFSTWSDEQQSAFEDWVEAFETTAGSWYSNKQTEFEAWVATLHDILDEETAGHLQLEIEEIIATEFNRFYGLANRTTAFTRNDDGSIATCTSTNSDETVVCVTTFTRNSDGSIASIENVVTPTGGTYYYTQTITFTRNSDGSIASITETYTQTEQ